MSRLLLFLSVLLLTVACKKDNPKPDPNLLGRWESQQTSDLEYSATGELLSQVNRPDLTYYMVVTSDSLNFYSQRYNSSWGKQTYVRQGDQITYGAMQVKCTIMELSEHTLILRYKNINKNAPNTPYSDVEDHYTR